MASRHPALEGYTRYRAVGQLAFLLHRITGLGILLFLVIHIIDTSFVYFAPELYDEAIQIYRSVPFMIGEIFLVWAVFYHGFNGIRIIIFDLWKPEWWEKDIAVKSVYWTLALSILAWLPAAYIMGRAIIENHFMGG